MISSCSTEYAILDYSLTALYALNFYTGYSCSHSKLKVVTAKDY